MNYLETAPRVSIIIPVYNTAEYLRRCLDSVCRQTLTGIEIICVNDASQDDSLAILEEYAAGDARIRVIDFTQNQGVSIARNAGVEAAQGEYLGFIDSDDAIDAHFYEALYRKARETSSVITKGDIQWILPSGKLHDAAINPAIRQNKLSFSAQWVTAIYLTAFIRDNDIVFPVGTGNGEDTAFLFKALCLVPHVETVDGVYYYYYRRHNSANSLLYSPEKLEGLIKAQEDIVAFINERGIQEPDCSEMLSRCIFKCCQIWQRAHPADKGWAVKTCAEAAVKIYSDLRRPSRLDSIITGALPGALELLQAKNIAGLGTFLIKYVMSRMNAK